MWPDWVSNPGPPTYESGALPIALRGPAVINITKFLEKGQEQGQGIGVVVINLLVLSRINMVSYLQT